MALREYVRVLTDRILVIGLVLGLLCGVAVTLLVPPSYQARSVVYVSAQGFMADAARAYSGNELSVQKIKSYLELMTGDRIREAVSRRLQIDVRPGQISAESTADTVLIDAVVTDPSPVRAQRIADTVALELVSLLAELEIPTDDPGSPAPVIARVVQSAAFPTHPSSPGPAILIALGGVLGLLLGYVVALARRMLDTTIRSAEQLGRVADAPVLGRTPIGRGGTSVLLSTNGDSHSEHSESLRKLRANLRFLSQGQTGSTMLVVGSMPGEGATTTACDLGVGLAQAGDRVVLVEADLRDPRASAYLGLAYAEVGLSDVLAGRASAEQAVRSMPGLPLDVLPSGRLPANPGELLASARMAELLDTLAAEYDQVLIDAPAVLPWADALPLAAYSNNVLLVAQHGSTSEDELTSSISALDTVSAHVLGTVLTMAPATGSHKRLRRSGRPGAATPAGRPSTPDVASQNGHVGQAFAGSVVHARPTDGDDGAGQG